MFSEFVYKKTQCTVCVKAVKAELPCHCSGVTENIGKKVFFASSPSFSSKVYLLSYFQQTQILLVLLMEEQL